MKIDQVEERATDAPTDMSKRQGGAVGGSDNKRPRTAPKGGKQVRGVQCSRIAPLSQSTEAARFRTGKEKAQQEVHSLLKNRNKLESALNALSASLVRAEQGAGPEFLLPFEREKAKLEALLFQSRALSDAKESAARDVSQFRREKADLEREVDEFRRLRHADKERFDVALKSLKAQWEDILSVERLRFEVEKSEIKADGDQRLAALRTEMEDFSGPWFEQCKAEVEAVGVEKIKAMEAELRKEFEEEKVRIEKKMRQSFEEETARMKEKLRQTIEEEIARIQQKERDDALICQICLKTTRNVMIVPCRHALYCKECLDHHTKQHPTDTGTGRCPTCRKDIVAYLA